MNHKFRNETGAAIIDIKSIVREYYKQIHVNNFNSKLNRPSPRKINTTGAHLRRN